MHTVRKGDNIIATMVTKTGKRWKKGEGVEVSYQTRAISTTKVTKAWERKKKGGGRVCSRGGRYQPLWSQKLGKEGGGL